MKKCASGQTTSFGIRFNDGLFGVQVKTEGTQEFSRFLVVGGINFVFTFLVFVTSLKVLGISYIIALILASVLGNILTYTLNFIWVFKPEERLNFRHRFVKYMISNLGSLCFNIVALAALVELGGFDPFWSQVALIPFIIVFNFSTAKWWSLRKQAGSD